MTGLNPSNVEVGLKDKMHSGVIMESHNQSGRVEGRSNRDTTSDGDDDSE